MTTRNDGFLVAPCDACDRRVLAAHDLGPDDRVVVVCVHCGERLDESAGEHVDAERLDALGYQLEGRRGAHGERGCRDGACGVTQPDG